MVKIETILKYNFDPGTVHPSKNVFVSKTYIHSLSKENKNINNRYAGKK